MALFVRERWLHLLKMFVGLADKDKILPNTFACEPNCLKTKAFVNEGTAVFDVCTNETKTHFYET